MIRHRAVTVGTTATSLSPLVDDSSGIVSIAVQNPSGGVTVYLGGPGVTSSDYGYALATGKEIALDVPADKPLYAAVATGTQAVTVLSVEA